MKIVVHFIVIGLLISSACSSKDDLIPHEKGEIYTFQFSSKKVNTKYTRTTLGRTNIRGENVFT